MQISYKAQTDKSGYESVLIINDESRWREAMYFTHYTPYEAEEEKLFVGRYMSDVHFRRKDCETVWVFDFHRWDSKTIDEAMSLDLLPVAFNTPVKELLEKALEERDKNSGDFTIKVKDSKK